MSRFSLSCILSFIVLLLATGLGSAADVHVTRVPGGGIQPQAVVDSEGGVHLVYFHGKAAAGDVFYVRRPKGSDEFSKPLRVNSQAGSAVAVGTIRNPQLAVGKGGRVHVAWCGSKDATPKGAPNPELPKDSPYRLSAPMLYARLNDAGTAFETQRNVMTDTFALDGGGSVAADDDGNVYVVWHAASPGGGKGEGHRAVFVAKSSDEGKTFSKETRANTEATGACGCCSLKAYASSAGGLHILYRAATRVLGRDMHLLESSDAGRSFQGRRVHAWNVPKCVMSSSSFVEAEGGKVFIAWETRGQVYFAERTTLADPVAAGGDSDERKHPVLAANRKGEILLVWTEGTGWKRGGRVAWQIFGEDGKPKSEVARRSGVPVWGMATAFANGDGSFTVLY